MFGYILDAIVDGALKEKTMAGYLQGTRQPFTSFAG
jgi:hypothetical protein